MLICLETINYRYQCPLIIGKTIQNQGNNYYKLLPITFDGFKRSFNVLIKSIIITISRVNIGGINV